MAIATRPTESPTALVKQAQKEVGNLIDVCTKLASSIKDDRTCVMAEQKMNEVKAKKKFLENLFANAVAKAKAAYDEIKGLRDQAIAPCDNALGILKPATIAYRDEQERMRRIEQKKRDDEAAAQAERDRQKSIKAAEKLGDKDLVKEIKAAPLPVAPPVLPPPVKAAGTVYQKRWYAEVTDLPTLIKAVLDGKAPADCIVPDMVYLNRRAVTDKDTLAIPGVLARSKTIV
jgi:hypothetical protein